MWYDYCHNHDHEEFYFWNALPYLRSSELSFHSFDRRGIYIFMIREHNDFWWKSVFFLLLPVRKKEIEAEEFVEISVVLLVNEGGVVNLKLSSFSVDQDKITFWEVALKIRYTHSPTLFPPSHSSYSIYPHLHLSLFSLYHHLPFPPSTLFEERTKRELPVCKKCIQAAR